MVDEEEEDNNTTLASSSGDGNDAMQSVLEDLVDSGEDIAEDVGATVARLVNGTPGGSSSTRTSITYGSRAVSASRRGEEEERESSAMEDAFDGTDGDESEDDEGGVWQGEDYGEESGREDWGRYAPGT